MVMVRHYRIGVHIDGEQALQHAEAINDPAASMRKIGTAMAIDPAQKGAPYAAGDAVIIRCIGERNLFAAGAGHGAVFFWYGRSA